MTEQHPVTPPPELVKQWLAEFYGPESMPGMAPGEMVLHVAAVAARWGADQELEACCKWLLNSGMNEPFIVVDPEMHSNALRASRRPKPPSLAEEALEALNEADQGLNESEWRPRSNTIRRALERLQALEGEQSPRS